MGGIGSIIPKKKKKNRRPPGIKKKSGSNREKWGVGTWESRKRRNRVDKKEGQSFCGVGGTEKGDKTRPNRSVSRRGGTADNDGGNEKPGRNFKRKSRLMRHWDAKTKAGALRLGKMGRNEAQKK